MRGVGGCVLGCEAMGRALVELGGEVHVGSGEGFVQAGDLLRGSNVWGTSTSPVTLVSLMVCQLLTSAVEDPW